MPPEQAPPVAARAAADAYWASVLRLLATTMLWSTAGLVVRLVHSADPFELNAIRAGAMAVVLVGWLRWRYGRAWLTVFRALDRPTLLVVPAFFAIGSTLWIVALSWTTVARAVVLGSTTPVFAAILAPLLAREPTRPMIWAAALVGVGGVFLIAAGPATPGLALNLGDLAALLNAALFACQVTMLRRSRHVDMVPAFVLGGLLAAILDLALAGGLSVAAGDVALIVLLGGMQLALPVILLARGARDVPAVQITLIALLEMVLAPLWVWLAVGEAPALATALGGLVIVAAVVLATAAREPTPRA